MKFTVTWTPLALAALASLWNYAADRAEITTAADSLDRLLANDPNSRGEARAEGVRILIASPLAIYFRVFDDDRLATVHAVWRWNA